MKKQKNQCINQCSGSGSICFWTFRIRILPSSSKTSEKNLDFYCFVTSLWLLSLKNIVNVPSKSNVLKNYNLFLVGMWYLLSSWSGYFLLACLSLQSVFVFLSLSVCLSICVFPSCLSVYLTSVYLYPFPSFYLSAYLPVYLSSYLSVYYT